LMFVVCESSLPRSKTQEQRREWRRRPSRTDLKYL
jgi:hypothetical protein